MRLYTKSLYPQYIEMYLGLNRKEDNLKIINFRYKQTPSTYLLINESGYRETAYACM